MLEFFTHEPQFKEKKIDVSPAFLEHGSRKISRFEHMQTAIQTSRRFDSILHEAAQNFELLSNIQDEKKN